MNDDLIVCRCEEVTSSEIHLAIREGASTIDGIKRATRAGMGLCQGRICGCLVERIISDDLHQPLQKLQCASVRPPIRVLDIDTLSTLDEYSEENT